MISLSLALALLSVMVLFSSATPGYYPTAPVTHCVNVSNDTAGLIYDPPYISATPGDTISFKFFPKNHTVTQSSFDAPCTSLYGGIDTGFIPVALGTNDDDLPTREIVVEDEKPIWIYCRQAPNTPFSHCGNGMVFAVNPGSDDSHHSFAAFRAKALAIGKQLAASTGAE